MHSSPLVRLQRAQHGNVGASAGIMEKGIAILALLAQHARGQRAGCHAAVAHACWRSVLGSSDLMLDPCCCWLMELLMKLPVLTAQCSREILEAAATHCTQAAATHCTRVSPRLRALFPGQQSGPALAQ